MKSKTFINDLPLKRAELTIPPPTARASPNFPIDSNSFAMTATYCGVKIHRRQILNMHVNQHLSTLISLT